MPLTLFDLEYAMGQIIAEVRQLQNIVSEVIWNGKNAAPVRPAAVEALLDHSQGEPGFSLRVTGAPSLGYYVLIEAAPRYNRATNIGISIPREIRFSHV
jgi:hypothetical protein